MSNYENLREKDTRWTPVTPEVLTLLERLRREAGNWSVLATATGVKARQTRRIRKGQQKCVSMSVMDRLLARSSFSHLLDDLPWYTVEELEEMGLWDQPLPHVKRREQARPDDKMNKTNCLSAAGQSDENLQQTLSQKPTCPPEDTGSDRENHSG